MENTTAAAHRDYTTQFYQSEGYLTTKTAMVEVLFVLIGLIAVSFNSWMIVVYIRHRKVRKRVSFMMLQLFIFCLCQGLTTGVLRVTHRIFLYQLPVFWCVCSNLILEFFDHYTLVLIALLAIERYIFVNNPYFSRNKMALGSKLAVSISVVVVLAMTYIPLAPFFGIPQTPYILSQNPEVAKQEIAYHLAVNCHNHMNRENIASPIITFALGLMSVSTLVTVYFRLYFIVKNRISRFNAMTHRRRNKLRKAARCVMWVASVFIVSILPYGIVLEVQTLCNIYNLQHSMCFLINSTLLDSFSVLASMSSFLAPGCFAILNPHIRMHMLLKFKDCECPNGENADNHSSTITTSKPHLPPTRKPADSDNTVVVER